jgi:hypothetical protein
MDLLKRSRTAIAIGVLFVVVGLTYAVLATPAGYPVEWAGATMLVALGASMGIMAWVLVAGSRRD